MRLYGLRSLRNSVYGTVFSLVLYDSCLRVAVKVSETMVIKHCTDAHANLIMKIFPQLLTWK